MANIIIPDESRKAEADHILKQYGVDPGDPAMREAAEISAARTREAVEKGNQLEQRRFY